MKHLATALVLAAIPHSAMAADAAQIGAQIKNEIMGSGEVIRDMTGLIASLGLNCASPDQWKLAMRELGTVLDGVIRVLVEEGALLALKPDYPTLCHVMTQAQIDTYTEASDIQTRHPCILEDWRGRCLSRKTVEHKRPKPIYYWPKYFVEVTQKGNDAHPSFAAGNRLYAANRKIATGLEKFIDIEGPQKVTLAVLGLSVLKPALGGALPGVNTALADTDGAMQQFMNTTILNPFEKNRIRANHEKTLPSFDANIWPVGLSRTFAENLSVCSGLLDEPGGYGWDFKGVPQTCPIAMSRDAAPLWDTGMIDYIDPQAIASMAAASNPLSCAGAQAAALGSQPGEKGDRETDENRIGGATSRLTDTLRKGLQTCSWPVLNSHEAIIKKAISAVDPLKWTGPYCTVWGSLAPRHSTSLYQNDFSYANTALKFKLFAHEIFGVTRGAEERWSLAYPWEGPGGLSGVGFLKNQFPFLSELPLENLASVANWDAGNIPGLNEIKEQLGLVGDLGKSRAEDLFLPGDPRLVDFSWSSKAMIDKATNLAKELGYLATITAGSTAAGQAAAESYRRYMHTDPSTADDMIAEMDETLQGAEDDTALVDKQPIYKRVSYCHRRDSNGLQYPRSDAAADKRIGGKPFQKGISKGACLNDSRDSFAGCQDWGGRWHGCRRMGQAWAEYREEMEIVGYEDVQHPVTITYETRCGAVGYHKNKVRVRVRKRKWENEIWTQECAPVEVRRTQDDTTEYAERPDPARPETLVENEQTASQIAVAAQAATWVGAELARARYSNMTGHNPLPGDRRIYTVWEKITCTANTSVTSTTFPGQITVSKYDNCEAAVKHEVKKYVQLKLLRKICDLMGKRVGDPWR